MSLYLTPVSPADVDAAWPYVNRWIERACHRTDNEQDTDTLQRLCREDKRYSLGLIEDDNGIVGAVVMNLTPAGWMHIVSLGGDNILASLKTLMPIWEWLASGCGAVGLSLKGRPGWARILRDNGFTLGHDGYLEKR